MLVWLKEFKDLKVNLIRADIFWSDLNLVYEVNKLQFLNKGSIVRNENKIEVVFDFEREMLKLFYLKEVFKKNFGVYMQIVIFVLKCRIDV